ncbi:MAG: hypothetical protein RDU13_10980 [Elusimicrobiales bacterium]|nr:hypothetical protein [Elusimicrobiales bacterium]
MKRALLFIPLFLFSAALHAYQCPAPAKPGEPAAEDALDCPWAGMARLMEENAVKGLPLAPVLADHAPGLAMQLASDKLNAGLKELWGESVNFDEMVRATIVHDSILFFLAGELALPGPRGKIVHAGMEHAYGYLFSLLPTKFGFKRARWVRDDIEAGLGFARGALGPSPAEGTLLANITCMSGAAAFADDAAAAAKLAKASYACGSAARGWKAPGHFRLTETVSLSRKRSVSLRTDFLPFTSVTSGGNAYLLVYSVKDTSRPHAVLVTAFPVGEGFVKNALNPEYLGEGKQVQTRYNAWVEGFNGKLKGTRSAAWVAGE